MFQLNSPPPERALGHPLHQQRLLQAQLPANGGAPGQVRAGAGGARHSCRAEEQRRGGGFYNNNLLEQN